MKEKDPSKVSWKQMFMFTRDGNLQNMDLMYSFFLGILILFVNFIIGNRLTILFEELFPSLSRLSKNILDILLPSLLCALAAWLLFRIIPKKKIVKFAYLMALIIAVVFVSVMAFMLDKDTNEVLLMPMISILAVPCAAGWLTAFLLYRGWEKKNPDPMKEEY